MKTKTILSVAAVAIAIGALAGCGAKKETETTENQPMKVIFETDMGNDIDDALAFDMLMKYQKEGKIELLGVATNKTEDGSIDYIDQLTTWYGCPDIALGRVTDGVPYLDAVNYARIVSEMKDSVGVPLFKRSHADDGFVVPAVEMYRKLLAEASDSSVTVISVGFSTNLVQLLDSKGDDVSSMTGKELVGKKVSRLVMMGGEFRSNGDADSLKRMPEFNIVCDRDAAAKLFAEWPTPIVTSPYELGEAILFPGELIAKNIGDTVLNPVVEGYKVYMQMPYDRPTWDLTSVLYAVEGPEGYFTESQAGKIGVDGRGGTYLIPAEQGSHRYLMADSIQAAKIRDRLIELINTPK